MSIVSNIRDYLKTSRIYFLTLSAEKAIVLISLSFIIVLTVFIRLLPGRYGFYISEFDPYLQFYATKVIIDGVKEKGIFGIFDFFTHHIDLTWQPEGVDLGLRYYPGVPYAGAITYLILSGLGLSVSIEEVAIFLPIFFSVVSVTGVYFLGKEIKNEAVGLLSALLLSVSPSFIPRSTLGWYDTESLGIPTFILSILFYLKAIHNEDTRKKVLYGFLSGVFAGIMSGSWGAFSYLIVLYSILPLIAVLVIELPKDYDIVHITTMTTFLMIVNSVPRNKLTYFTGVLAILIYLSIAVVLLNRILDFKQFFSTYRILTGGILIALFIILVINLLPVGISSRYLSVVNPFYKSEAVFVTTVQEQAGVNVGAFLQNFNILIPFIIFGIYILAIKEVNVANLFILILALSTIYAASNFARLFILAAPIMTILSAYAIDSIMEKLYEKGSKQTKHKKFGKSGGSRVYAFSIIIILVLLLSLFNYTFGMSAASIPPTIAQAGTPLRLRINDWLEALAWIKDNVPNDSIVAAWWDYGYWISFVAGKKSLADNGTLNQSRIKLLAEMFLSNESRALEILDQLGADYVLIFLGVMRMEQGNIVNYQFTGYGEDTKFIQMARIAGIPTDMFINDMETRINMSAPYFKDAFWDTFLGKLIPYEYITTQVAQGRQPIDLYRYAPKYPEKPDGSSKLVLVFRSGDEFWYQDKNVLYYKPGEVLIYKVVRDGSS